jgi:AraC family transcriptional regulator
MTYQQAAIREQFATHPIPHVSRWDEAEARLGVRIRSLTTEPGQLELTPSPDHRVKIHVGSPVRGACMHHRFRYTRGDIDVHPAGYADVWHEKDHGSALVLQFSPLLLQRAASDMGLDPSKTGLDPRFQFRSPQIEHIAWALDAECRAGYPGGLVYSESLGLALSAHLLGQAPRVHSRGLSRSQLDSVRQYIEAHLDQELSIAHLASVAGIGPSQFKIHFRRSMGLPVHQYIVQRRVEHAKALLLLGKLPASQIALEAGFAHQSHMAKWMKRVLGVTPAAISSEVTHQGRMTNVSSGGK